MDTRNDEVPRDGSCQAGVLGSSGGQNSSSVQHGGESSDVNILEAAQSLPNALLSSEAVAGHRQAHRKKLRATAAAITAVRSAAPGQRERVVTDAVHVASADVDTPQMEQSSVAVPDTSLGVASAEGGLYKPPDWGQQLPDQEFPISLDVLKSGAVLSTIPILSEKPFVIFGRNPDADVRVDHASTSRLHAVLQYGSRAVLLADLGSTHGSYLNKKRLKPFLFHRVEVGAQIRLGQSTRSYVVNAPQDWQLPEGPNMYQRRQARQEQHILERIIAAAERDRAIAEKTMQAALKGRSNWDAQVADVGGNDGAIDWRAKMESCTLSEKQMKIAECIRSKEYKVQRTQDAVKKLRRREGPDQDLTPGQAAALFENEKAIDRLQQELDDLEESMQESLRDSTRGRQAQDKSQKNKKQARRRADRDSDGDDTFFDRTGSKKVKVHRQALLTARSLVTKLKELQDEERGLDEQLQAAKSRVANICIAPVADELDSMMSSVAAQGAAEDVRKLEHLLCLTRQQLSQQQELLDIADPHQEHRSTL
eukprot:jgi/Ulvmu1/8235/UM041_0045.1